MHFLVPCKHRGNGAPAPKGSFRHGLLPSAGFSKRFKEDISVHLMNIKAFAGPERLGIDCLPGKTHFERAVGVFMQAIAAYEKGHKRFIRFKFSKEFKKELIGFAGRRGGTGIFNAWASDASGEVEGILVRESSAFEDSFYGGNVNGKPNCQNPTLRSFHVGGIIGTIELPWIKQIVVGNAEDGFDYRRRLFLMKGQTEVPVLLMQPAYFREDLPHADELDAKAIEILKGKYEPLGVDVRLMPSSMLSSDEGINTGYSTFASGRSPLFYIDSNCHSWEFGGEVFARNGLHPREEGQSIDFGKGWDSKRQLNACMS